MATASISLQLASSFSSLNLNSVSSTRSSFFSNGISPLNAAGLNSLKLRPKDVKSPLLIEAREPTRREKVKVRHMRIRKTLSGTPERPRLAVFRSNKHIYAQVIDDTKSHTLASASTLAPPLREELTLTAGPTVEAAKKVGLQIGKVCLEKGIDKVCFDRGGFIYHGKIKAVADGAREAGLNF